MTNLLEKFAGKVCEVLLPIKHDIFYGNKNSNIALCTLSSIDLLEQISKSNLMNKVVIAARLFSENEGIEKLVKSALEQKIKYIILCGKDTRGHLPGQALLALQKNGIDADGRIIGAEGKNPMLENVKHSDVEEFRKNVSIIDLVGTVNMNRISEQVEKLRV